MKSLLSKEIELIIRSVTHILNSQTSLAIDFVRKEDFTEWERINQEFVDNSLENLADYLKGTIKNENIV